MAEDWEDWENEDFTPQLPSAPAQPAAADDDVAATKFAGEDEEEEEKQYNVPKPQQVHNCLSTWRAPYVNSGAASQQTMLIVQAKPGKKKTYEDKDTAVRIEDETLDDPIAEKLRRQRCHKVSALAAFAFG